MPSEQELDHTYHEVTCWLENVILGEIKARSQIIQKAHNYFQSATRCSFDKMDVMGPWEQEKIHCVNDILNKIASGKNPRRDTRRNAYRILMKWPKDRIWESQPPPFDLSIIGK